MTRRPFFSTCSLENYFIYYRNLTTLTGISANEARDLEAPPVRNGRRKFSFDIFYPLVYPTAWLIFSYAYIWMTP